MTEILSKTFLKPAAFGTEPLSASIDVAIHNIFATYCHKSEWYGKFLRVDEAFSTAFQNISDTKDLFFGLLLARAHGAFRGACMLTMSGHTVEAYMLLRGCLEAALYALHMEANPGLCGVWLNRHDDRKAENACRDSFKYGKANAKGKKREALQGGG